eukprot:12924125-Prorocentrum_lima.AAC.1
MNGAGSVLTQEKPDLVVKVSFPATFIEVSNPSSSPMCSPAPAAVAYMPSVGGGNHCAAD